MPTKRDFFNHKTIEELISFGKENPKGVSELYIILIRKLTGLTYGQYNKIPLQDLKSQFGPFLKAEFLPPAVPRKDITLNDIEKAAQESGNMEAAAEYLGLSFKTLRERIKELTIPNQAKIGHYKALRDAFLTQFDLIKDSHPPKKQSAYLVLMSLTPVKIYNAYKKQNSNATETAKELGVTTEELESRLRCFVLNGNLLTLESLKEHFEQTKEASVAAAASSDHVTDAASSDQSRQSLATSPHDTFASDADIDVDGFPELEVSTLAAKLIPAGLDQAAIISGKEALDALSNLLSPERNKSIHGSKVSTLQAQSDEVPILSGPEAIKVLSNLLSPDRNNGSKVSPVASSPLSDWRLGLFSQEQKRKESTESNVDNSETNPRKKKPF